MPEIPQIDRLIAEVAARHGILLKKDDAAFALVTLNQLVLESAIADLVAQTRVATADLEAAMERVQVRAGAVIAKDIGAVVLDMTDRLGSTTQAANRRLEQPPAAISWRLVIALAAGLVVGLLLGWTR